MFAGSLGAAPFWRNIFAGTDLITDVPPTHWRIDDYYDPNPAAPDKTYAKRGAFLPPVPFDPLAFGIPPSTLSATDTAQLLALIVAKQVLADAARGEFQAVDRRRISVILGVASATELVVELGSRIQRPVWTNAMRGAGLSEAQITDVCDRIAGHYVPWQEASFPGLLGNVVAGRIANRLDLGGTNAVTDAACASSFAALEMSLNELYLGQSDLVIAGGVDAINDIFMYMCFSKTPALSATGDCRPLSAAADGTLLGEGLGMFALRRLEDAERDGNPIYAVIRGLGSSSDGRATSIYGPKSEGQALALSRAYEAAGYSPATVGLVEAHGTGTKAGDTAEVAALTQVFGAANSDQARWCALGSIKSQIGHTKAAAGAAGLFKVVMALRHKVLPPTIKVDRPAAAIAADDSPFYVSGRARPWIASAAHPRRASVSSFGFGGSNFHVTVEEYAGARVADRLPTHGTALFLLSAATRPALATAGEALAKRVVAGTFFAEAHASQLAFASSSPARAAIVADSADDLGKKLAGLRKALASDAGPAPSAGIHVAFGPATAGDLAFVFPGQGSQYVGMGADLAMAFDAARDVWDAAAGEGGPPLHDVVFPPPAFDADATTRQHDALVAAAQPAIAAVSLAQLALLRAAGLTPSFVAGHSFGEVMALHCAGAFDATTAVRIARQRSDVMRTAAADSDGAMTAVAAGRAQVEALLKAEALDVLIANDNAPDQVVLSGGSATVAECERVLSAAGMRVTRLPVASAFHSPMVSGASVPFAQFLATQAVASPAIPVYGTAAAVPYPSEPDSIRATLATQLAVPVRFREQIEALYAAGARTFIEVGPAAVLSGLIERCLGARRAEVIALDRKGRDGVSTFWEALGRLAVTGCPISFAPLWAGVRADEPIEPTTPATVQILGSNFGKPYPANIERARPATTPAPVPAAVPALAVAPAAATPDRMAAFAAFQAQIADSQRAFQNALAESHRAFLATTEKAMHALSGTAGSLPIAAPIVQAMAPPPPAPIAMALVPAPAAAPPVWTPPRVATPTPVAPPADPATILLEVVAAKTGYPVEMLNLSMSLESDLGVDSIKQVEILAALRERAPGLPEVDSAELARLRTLGALVEFLGARPAPVAAPARTAAVAPQADIEAILLAVVAEKTGYPAEMLNLSMSVEGDLGVDSIKQVEILSALRDRASGVRAMEPGDLARLRTLGAIVEFLRGGSDSAATPQVATSAVPRAVVTEVDAPRASAAPARTHRRFCIVPDRGGIATALAAALTERGRAATVAADAPQDCDAVVYLAGLDAGESVSRHRDALLAAKAVAPRLARDGGLFVTVGDSSAGVIGFSGLVKCAAHEWPAATVKAIDIATAGRTVADIAAVLAEELVHGGTEHEVRLPDASRRLTFAHRSIELSAVPTKRLDDDSVVVVSGGARGVTAAAAIALAREHHCRLLLLGRTPLETEPPQTAAASGVADIQRALAAKGGAIADIRGQAERILASREVRATLAEIERTGGTARYITADVRDAQAVAVALDDVRRAWGPITGLIHGAGVIADKRIADKTVAQFDTVFGTKVVGLQVLLEALRNDPLRVLCVFSSVAARSGNAGQSDYAMANAAITQMAHAEKRRRGAACLVKAIHWGPWAGGMVTPALAARFVGAGVPLVPLDAGAEFLVRELADAIDGALEVVAGGPLPGAPVPQPTLSVTGPA